MKAKFLFLLTLMPIFMFAQVYQKHSLQKDRLSIQFNEGTLYIIPLSGKAIRVQWEKSKIKEER